MTNGCPCGSGRCGSCNHVLLHGSLPCQQQLEASKGLARCVGSLALALVCTAIQLCCCWSPAAHKAFAALIFVVICSLSSVERVSHLCHLLLSACSQCGSALPTSHASCKRVYFPPTHPFWRECMLCDRITRVVLQLPTAARRAAATSSAGCTFVALDAPCANVAAHLTLSVTDTVALAFCKSG